MELTSKPKAENLKENLLELNESEKLGKAIRDGIQQGVYEVSDVRHMFLENDNIPSDLEPKDSLTQLKDVTYIIKENDGITTVSAANEDEKELCIAGIGDLDEPVRIKIINVGEGEEESFIDGPQAPEQAGRPGPPTVLSEDGFYRCIMCTYRTDKRANWYKHRYKHMGRRPYKCEKCDYKATSSSNLKRHMLTHTDLKMYRCEICSMEFRQKIHLDRHTKYKHEEKKVKCEYCDYVCSNYNPDLKTHMKRKHFLQCGGTSEGLPVQFRCDTCGFTAASARDLKQHKKFHRPGPELKLFCEHCSFVTDCKSRLRRHILVHSKEKPYQCTLCDYRASQKEHINRHYVAKHKEKSPFEIEKNSQESEATGRSILIVNQKGRLLNSDTIFQGDNPITSEVDVQRANLEPEQKDQSQESTTSQFSIQDPCSKTTSPKYTRGTEDGEVTPDTSNPSFLPVRNLPVVFPQLPRKKYKPQDYSQKEKNFTCIHCTMKFAKLINLYKHLSVQHKDINASRTDGLHSCVWCQYQTNKWKNLLVHMRKHNYREGGNPNPQQSFSCVLCSYSNPRRRALYSHMIKKHKMQIYIKSDGTADCVVEDASEEGVFPSDGSRVVVQAQAQGTVSANDSSKSPKQIPQTINQPNTVSGDGKKQVVMIELEPGMPAQPIEICPPSRSDSVGHEAADAIEGLQALAEQVIAAGHQSDPEKVEGSLLDQKREDGNRSLQEQGNAENTDVALMQEEIMQLSSGDLIEINGEMYKVEVSDDPNAVLADAT